MIEKLTSYCGLKCDECYYRVENNCKCCIASSGNPFHGKCEIAECVKKRNIRFCGECSDFPCEILNRYSYDKDFGDYPAGQRIENCRLIKKQLVEEARKGLSMVGVCGHHCDYCWLGQWCGGCRSNYNCCSFATISEDKVCLNVKCAKERELTGCYECNELATCEKGYYGNKNEYIAKATALFIKKHGTKFYEKTLKSAIASGINYPKDFDESGSVEASLAILEKVYNDIKGKK